MAPLAAPTDLNTYLGQAVPTAQATMAVDLASAVVRSYAGWRIDQAAETLRAGGTTGQELLLPTLRLLSVTSVTVDGVAVAAMEYGFTEAGVLIRRAGWSASRIEVACTHGYSPVPDDVRAVVLSAAARAVTNPEGLRSVTMGTGYSETYAASAGEPAGVNLLGAERRIIDRHRIFT